MEQYGNASALVFIVSLSYMLLHCDLKSVRFEYSVPFTSHVRATISCSPSPLQLNVMLSFSCAVAIPGGLLSTFGSTAVKMIRRKKERWISTQKYWHVNVPATHDFYTFGGVYNGITKKLSFSFLHTRSAWSNLRCVLAVVINPKRKKQRNPWLQECITPLTANSEQKTGPLFPTDQYITRDSGFDLQGRRYQLSRGTVVPLN